MKAARLILAVAVAATGTANIAAGHDATVYYQKKWNGDVTIPWRFVSGFPAGEPRSRVIDAANRWNNVGTPLQWQRQSSDWSSYDPRRCDTRAFQANGVHWAETTVSSYLAQVVYCLTAGGGSLHNVQMIIDKTPSLPWWTSSSTSVPTNRMDMYSVAAHEWGHMAGSLRGGPNNQGHFDEADNRICSDVRNGGERQTLCPNVISGDPQQRSLEGARSYHDTHTFQTAYENCGRLC